MILSAETLTKLFTTHREAFRLTGELLLDSKPFNTAFQYIEENLENHFDWNELRETATIDSRLLSILNACIIKDEDKQSLIFDEHLARKAIISIKAQQLYLAHDAQLMGIQEKYLKSQLTLQEPLTDLDIKRFIVNTAMLDHIPITTLNTRDIGIALHQVKKKQGAALRPPASTTW